MLILAVESSSGACSVALARAGIVVAEQNAVMARGHAAALPPMIAAVLEIGGVTGADLAAIARVDWTGILYLALELVWPRRRDWPWRSTAH